MPPERIAMLTFIVPLNLSYEGAGIRSARRRVEEVAFIQPNGTKGFSRHRLARWHAASDSFDVLDGAKERQAFARWCDISEQTLMDEVDRRAEFLNRLMEEGTSSIPEVNAAIERFYEAEIIARRSA